MLPEGGAGDTGDNFMRGRRGRPQGTQGTRPRRKKGPFAAKKKKVRIRFRIHGAMLVGRFSWLSRVATTPLPHLKCGEGSSEPPSLWLRDTALGVTRRSSVLRPRGPARRSARGCPYFQRMSRATDVYERHAKGSGRKVAWSQENELRSEGAYLPTLRRAVLCLPRALSVSLH